MFLESIQLKNFRSIRELEISFETPLDEQGESEIRKWTLLLGQNGVGKSSLLKAIGLLLGGSDALAKLLGQPSSWVRNRCKAAEVSGVLRTAQGERREIALRINKDDSISELLYKNRGSLDPLDRAISHTARNYFVVGYGALRRLAIDESIARRSQKPLRAQSLETLFDSDAVLNPLQSWAMGLEYRTGDEGLRIIRRTMNDLLPDVSFVTIDRDQGDLIFKTPDGNVPLSYLSDGYQNVAAWIGDLLYRITDVFGDYQKPMEARGLLLIDEIDSHLHPAWQRQLREFLTNKLPNFQIIGTSHSLLTMHQFGEGECFILERDSDSRNAVQLRAFPGAPNDLRAHQVLTLAFEVESLDSMLLEKKKDEYRLLRDKHRSKKKLSKTEAKRLAKLRDELGELPKDRGNDFGNTVLRDYVSKQQDTLERLQKKLETTGQPKRRGVTKRKSK